MVLGFTHEVEFVILTLAIGGINPLRLMIAYPTAVPAGLIGITLIAVKVYSYNQQKVIQYAKCLPRISALILAVMAIGIAAEVL
jgi:hypothetical protein